MQFPVSGTGASGIIHFPPIRVEGDPDAVARDATPQLRQMGRGADIQQHRRFRFQFGLPQNPFQKSHHGTPDCFR